MSEWLALLPWCERKVDGVRSLRFAARATRRFAGVLAGASVGVLVMGGGAGNASSPPAGQSNDGVSAILVDAWSGCFVGDAWRTLNTDWSTYGSVPVSITSGGHLCDGTFTLSDLEASGADTVILDSTAYNWKLTADQI